MSSQTTYLELNKPSGTDLVNPLVDTNPNWDKIDAGHHELDERSIANATETVVLGVHAISTLNTYTKFIRWIATANFTAGETFTVNGDAVAATTPAGATLATGAYVTGSVVLACLNADNTAMTIFVSGTNVATDSERLGGELPSYYATDSDMNNAQADIGNIQALLGSTSIAAIGDGTVTGAIDSINNDLSDISPDYSTTPHTACKWIDGSTDVYEKTIHSNTSLSIGTHLIDSSINLNKTIVDIRGMCKVAGVNVWHQIGYYTGGSLNISIRVDSEGVKLENLGYTLSEYQITIRYF